MIPFLPIDRYYSLFGMKLPIWGTLLIISAYLFGAVYFEQVKKYKLDMKHAIAILIHFAFWTLIGFHLYRVFFVMQEPSMLFQSYTVDSFGAIFGFIAVAIYMWRYKLDTVKMLDMIALPLIVAATVQRIACMLIADEYGARANLPWSMYYENALRHPVGLYYFVVSLVILGVIYCLSRKKLRPGNLILSFGMMYCFTRVIIDSYRLVPPHIYNGLSVHQVAYGAMFIVCALLFVLNNNLHKALKYRLQNFPVWFTTLFFPFSNGRFFMWLYIYFRWIDDYVDNPKIKRDDKIKFMKQQLQFMKALKQGNKIDENILYYEQRLAQRLVQGMRKKYGSWMDKYGRELTEEAWRLLLDYISTFEFDAKRMGRRVKKKELLDYSKKIGAGYAFAFMMVFRLYDPKYEQLFVKHTGDKRKYAFWKDCYDYAHYAHVVHLMRDYKKDKRLGYDNLPNEFRNYNDFFDFLIKYLNPCIAKIRRYKPFDKIDNILLRFAVQMYYYRFEYVYSKIKNKEYNVLENYSSFKAFLYGLKRFMMYKKGAVD